MPRTLLIDNFDSFTHNLAALIHRVSGEAPLVIRNDEMSWPEARALDISRIVISPGPGTPERPSDVGICMDAIRDARLPTLGICLGHQAIAHHFGARVCRSEPVHGRSSEIRHVGTDLFDGVPNPFRAVRYHSLAARDLPACLKPLAWTWDGTLMALRHEHLPLWGLQFHPESILSEYGERLLLRFFGQSAAGGTPSLVPIRPPRSRSADHLHTRPSRIFSQEVHGTPSAARIFDALLSDSETSFWLDSASADLGSAHVSYMGDAAGPKSQVLRYSRTRRELAIRSRTGSTVISTDNFTAYLKAQIAERHVSGVDCPVDFPAGFIGYLSYEYGLDERVRPMAEAPTPDGCWILADRIIAVAHDTGKIFLMALDDPEGLCPENAAWLSATAMRIQSLSETDRPSPHATQSNATLSWRMTLPAYTARIRQAQELIASGESYEVCLTNQVEGQCSARPYEVYRALREVNPAPFGAYLRDRDLAVLSASPELFLQVSAEGDVRCKPIKGTSPRNSHPTEDARQAEDLRSSIKDRAENLMIVDLVRNDLNRICVPGSVQVPEIFAVESYETVHQLVSTIEGALPCDASPLDCVQMLSPGGSMTGAPKLRTTQILAQLEGSPRGIYSGALGYLSFAGSAKLSILIRTIVCQDGRISLGAGGAVTTLSDPTEESREMLRKLAPQLEALRRSGVRIDIAELLDAYAEPAAAVAPDESLVEVPET